MKKRIPKPNRKRLSLSDRVEIAKLLFQKKNFKQIAEIMGRSEQTVSEEIERGGGSLNYDVEKAQIEFSKKCLIRIKNAPITEEEIEEIKELRRQGMTVRKIREMTRRGNMLVNSIVKDIPFSSGHIDKRNKTFRQIESLQQQINILFELIEGKNAN